MVCFWPLLDHVATMWAAETQHSVLVIYSDRNNLPGNVLVDETIRSVLASSLEVPVDLRTEFINNTSSLSEEASAAVRDFLRSKYAGTSVEVILAVGNDALYFVGGYGQELFPGTPVVSWGSRDLVESWAGEPLITGVLEPEPVSHLKGALDFILKLQPDAHEVFVVSGASTFDRQRESLARQAFHMFENRVQLTYLSGLPLEVVQHRLANLPEESAVYFVSMTEDGAGRKMLNRDVLVRLTRTTNAPVYAASAVHLGSGIVGGFLLNQENMAREAAEIVIRILAGEHVRNIPLQESRAVSMVDWHQLRRWNINENRLPPGTTVLYKEPSFWSLYKGRLIFAISLFTVEALLILALLIQQNKRKRAEEEATRSREVLQSTIDALDARIALLDENINIIAVNESWRRFAESNGDAGDGYGVGKNYMEICQSSTDGEEAQAIKEGLRGLVTGASSDFSLVYNCSDGGNECWFQLKASRFLSQGVLRLALAHENITEIKHSHDIQQQVTGLLLQAQDEERRRIAHGLHEVTAQTIAAIKADLARAQVTAKSVEAHLDEALRQSVSLSDKVIKELRTLSYLLHPPLLDEAGLVAALRWYVRGFVQQSGISVEIFVIENIGRLSTDVETALFRVVQESLTNIHRHSGSHSAVIWLTKDENEIVVRIQDDGHGMTGTTAHHPKVGQTLGVGILGMRQRLRQLGGRLEIESDSHGTTVTARTRIPKEGYVAYSCG
jgi:signal transduction histidine kinase